MTIYFTETESSEEEFYRASFAGCELRFTDALIEVPSDAEVLSIFLDSCVDAGFLAEHPRLRFIAARCRAVDHIDLGACRKRGVVVCCVPDYGETTVAEHTFALILALSRRLREVMAAPHSPGPPFSYESTRAFDLAGRTLGLIGFGQIGQRVARLARAFEMEVLAYDPYGASTADGREIGVEMVPFKELLARSDFISLHARLSPTTFHLLNREAFDRCRPGVFIINTARGCLIDTNALREALDSGRVAGAGLDVLEEERVMRESFSQIITSEIVEHLHSDAPPQATERQDRLDSLQELVTSDSLLARHNVVFTPHVAFNSAEAVERLHRQTVENIRAFLAGKPINLA